MEKLAKKGKKVQLIDGKSPQKQSSKAEGGNNANAAADDEEQ